MAESRSILFEWFESHLSRIRLVREENLDAKFDHEISRNK